MAQVEGAQATPLVVEDEDRRSAGRLSMVELILYAVPAFVLLLAVEAISFKIAAREDLKGYELKDTRTSLSMGMGNVVVNAGWKAVVLVIYAGLYELTPLRVPSNAWWAWGALFFLDDFAYYWFHRISHEVRVFWASHVVHHSSQYFNLSTALRQTWVPMTFFPFWMPIALLGFKPWMIFASGIMIIWDRLFGTFQGEEERVRYGLTKNIRWFSPPKVAFHEYVAVWRDVRGARDWRERVGYALRGPDGHPAPSSTPRRCPPSRRHPRSNLNGCSSMR